MVNKQRKLTVAVYYHPREVYYIALTPDTFGKHISPYVGRMMDVYIGYLTLSNRKKMKFEATGTFVPSANDDETSGN